MLRKIGPFSPTSFLFCFKPNPNPLSLWVKFSQVLESKKVLAAGFQTSIILESWTRFSKMFIFVRRRSTPLGEVTVINGFNWKCLGLSYDLELDSRFSHSPEGCGLPVCLFSLFPHHHVEAGRVLVPEDEPSIVIIRHRVDVEGSLKVHTTECSVTWITTVVLVPNKKCN